MLNISKKPLENREDSLKDKNKPSSLISMASSISIDALQDKIMVIAKDLMTRHYLFDVDELTRECIHLLKDIDRQKIMSAINDLVRKKMLINGKAVTREKLLDNPVRASILGIIKCEPGIYFNKIKERLNTDSRTLQWHLKMLEEFGIIRIEPFYNNIIYFSASQDKKDDMVFYYLQKEWVPVIFQGILDNPGISFLQILEVIKIPRSTLMRQVKILIDEGLLSGEYDSGKLTSISIANAWLEIIKKNLQNEAPKM